MAQQWQASADFAVIAAQTTADGLLSTARAMWVLDCIVNGVPDEHAGRPFPEASFAATAPMLMSLPVAPRITFVQQLWQKSLAT